MCLYTHTNTKFKLANFIKHKHPIETFDYIVCWKIDIEENRAYKANNESCVFVNDNVNKYLGFNDKKIYIIELKSIINSLKSNLQHDYKNLNINLDN